MKEISGTIQYNGKEYKLSYNLNVMEIIQEKYGTLEEWGRQLFDGEPKVSAILFGFRAMLNESIEIDNEANGTDIPLLTEKQVGRLITSYGLQRATDELLATVNKSTESQEKN